MWGGVLAVLALVGFWRLVSPGQGTLEADLSNLDGDTEAALGRHAGGHSLPGRW